MTKVNSARTYGRRRIAVAESLLRWQNRRPMLKRDVLKFYGGSGARAGRAIGLSRSAVCKWGRRIPALRALQYQVASQGQLRFDMTDYELNRGRGIAKRTRPKTNVEEESPDTITESSPADANA